jgi:hypothetical protein
MQAKNSIVIGEHVTTTTKPIIPRVVIILVLLNSYRTADSNCSYRRPIRIIWCMLAMHSSLKNKIPEQMMMRVMRNRPRH